MRRKSRNHPGSLPGTRARVSSDGQYQARIPLQTQARRKYVHRTYETSAAPVQRISGSRRWRFAVSTRFRTTSWPCGSRRPNAPSAITTSDIRASSRRRHARRPNLTQSRRRATQRHSPDVRSAIPPSRAPCPGRVSDAGFGTPPCGLDYGPRPFCRHPNTGRVKRRALFPAPVGSPVRAEGHEPRRAFFPRSRFPPAVDQAARAAADNRPTFDEGLAVTSSPT